MVHPRMLLTPPLDIWMNRPLPEDRPASVTESQWRWFRRRIVDRAPVAAIARESGLSYYHTRQLLWRVHRIVLQEVSS